MGCGSTCNIWETFASAIHAIVQFASPESLLSHLTDDFLFMGASDFLCLHGQLTFSVTCDMLGVPRAKDKSTRPSTSEIFVGFEIDTVVETAALPEEKIIAYRDNISEILAKKRVPVTKLMSLAGKLNFAAAIVPGRAFLRRVYDQISTFDGQNFVFLTRGLKHDLQIWLTFLQNFNGITLYRLADPYQNAHFHMGADACDLGFAATFGPNWIQCKFSPNWKRIHISSKEFYPVYVMLSMFSSSFTNMCLVISLFSDSPSLGFHASGMRLMPCMRKTFSPLLRASMPSACDSCIA